MTQTIVSVVLFLVILALLPLAIRWYQQRAPGGAAPAAASRIVSTLAVGPQQRVVTVEVGPEGARVWLVLGVTPQNVNCLHSLPVGSAATRSTVFVSAADKPAADAGGSA
ncbi:MAG: flagellar biosynthetic protein FliO [Burkholderiales bacterium]|nr:flagellar biosynthetic protein FliO [Burkholderiales bacterium]